MTEKPDIRAYINRYVPGGKTESGQRSSITAGAEFYVENKKGTVFETFLRHLRPGSVVEVEELHYLAPGNGRADKRRRVLAGRYEAIHRRGATIRETFTGLQSCKGKTASMLLRGYEQIASSGRARKRPGEGRPPEWPRPPATMEAYDAIWRRRGLNNDQARRGAIIAKFGAAPSMSWLRNNLGSPTKVKAE